MGFGKHAISVKCSGTLQVELTCLAARLSAARSLRPAIRCNSLRRASISSTCTCRAFAEAWFAADSRSAPSCRCCVSAAAIASSRACAPACCLACVNATMYASQEACRTSLSLFSDARIHQEAHQVSRPLDEALLPVCKESHLASQPVPLGSRVGEEALQGLVLLRNA